MQTFPLNDFSGGLTSYIFNTPPNTCERLENWHIRIDRSLEVRHGSSFYDASKPKISDNWAVSGLMDFYGDLISFSRTKVYQVDTELTGPTGNSAFLNGTANSIHSYAKLGDEYFISDGTYSPIAKMYKDSSDVTQLRTAGLPIPNTTPNGTPSDNDGLTRSYAVVYSYQFQIGTLTYLDVSSPIYFLVENGPDLDGTKKIDLDSLPEIENLTSFNFDESNINVDIYRTTSDASGTYFKVGSVTNGTTTFEDTVTDEDLILNEVLYTSQGIVPNDPPPRAKYLVESNNAIWYLNIQDGGITTPNRGRQSIQLDGDSCPGDFFFDLDSAITGGGSVNDKLIVFTNGKTYRIDGILTEFGDGSIIPENISETIGCVSHASIVETNEGVYFASQDGFYFTDGFRLKKISDNPQKGISLDDLYKQIVKAPEQIKGTYDRFNKRVYWTYSDNNDLANNILVFEERHQAFTGFKTNDDFAPSSLLFTDDLIRGDKRGYIFKHDSGLYNDLEIDTSKSPADWEEIPIIYTWKSSAWDLGAFDHYKYITKISVSGKPTTNVDFAIRSYNEGETSYKELTPSGFIPQISWGDNISWNQSGILWNKITFLNKTRRFPRGGLRAKHRQIEITNAYVTQYESSSDASSYVSVNSSTKVISHVTPSEYAWNTNLYGYYITVNGIDYKILSNTQNSLTVEDSEDTLIDGNYSYIIKGYTKGQRPHIHNLVLYYTLLDNDGAFPGQAGE